MDDERVKWWQEQGERQKKMGLGDAVAVAAKTLGFTQKEGCGCAQRQAALNNVDLSQSIAKIAVDAFNAIRQA